MANSQVQFIVLDGVMVLLACISLTVMHPGIGFGDEWAQADFPFWKWNGAEGVVTEAYEGNGNLAVEVKEKGVTQETRKLSNELAD